MRKILLSTLGIMIMVCIIFLGYEIRYSHKKEVNNMMAIYIEEEKGTGKYQKTNLYKWPNNSEYALNMHKTYCENGSILRYNLETNKINVKVKGTDKCYVYFDKASYGTEEHPYLIQTIEDLVKLSNKVNAGTSYAGEYFSLTNDLDFNDASDYEDAERTDFNDINGINGNEALIKELTTGSGFVPIGKDSTNSFQGIFDGNNKRIDNLYINNSTPDVKLGLFGIAINNTIKNITVSGDIKGLESKHAAGIVAQSWGGKYTNCHNEVNVVIDNSKGSVGGIIGSSGAQTISKCTNKGNISGGSYTGGLIGYHNDKLTMTDSINYGNINSSSNAVGGLIGKCGGENPTTIINNSHNEGNITSSLSTAKIGGLVGTSGEINITNSSNKGKVEGGEYTAGILGYSNNQVTITNSHNEGNISSNQDSDKYIGGLIGIILGKFKIESSYNTGNITIENKDTTFYNFIGGIIGNIGGTGNISKCYNNGNISGGNRIGGIIGQTMTNGKSIIIDKTYNAGNVTSIGGSHTWGYEAGGIIGCNHVESIIYILNSYNTNNIYTNSNDKKGVSSGLIGYNSDGTGANYGYTNIYNSYNTGKVSGAVSALGITYSASQNTLNLMNIYNAGKIECIENSDDYYSIGKFLENLLTATNIYYINDLKSSNLANFGLGLTENQIKNKEMINNVFFIDTLNKNVESINLEEIDPLLKDYTLSKWQLGSDGYPELVNE